MPAVTEIPRGQWVRAFARLDPHSLKRAARRVAEELKVEERRLCEGGLAMLRLRECCYGEDFLLGEFPLGVAEVIVRSRDGRSGTGAAQVMDSDPDLALAMAVLDAVLAHRLPGWEQAAELVADGQRLVLREDAVRAAVLERTTVRFTGLEETEDHDRSS